MIRDIIDGEAQTKAEEKLKALASFASLREQLEAVQRAAEEPIRKLLVELNPNYDA